MKYALIILAVIALSPTVVAGTVEGSYQSYNLDTHAVARNNPAIAALFVNAVDATPTHGFPIADSYAIITVAYTAHFTEASTGRWRYDAYWDDAQVADCSWELESASMITSIALYPHIAISCRLAETALGVGEHEFLITRASISGTPATIGHETISYTIDRIDLLEPDMTNETLDALIAFAPLLALLAFIIWAEWSRTLPMYIAAIVVGIVTVATLEPALGSLRLSIVLVIVAVILRAFIVYMSPQKEDGVVKTV